MKRIMSYKGYTIGQYTSRDNVSDYQIGDYVVRTIDNEIEYDSIGTIVEAQEKIDGLKTDNNKTLAWSQPQQVITSADTSINSSHMARTFKVVDWKQGTINADIGGGRFNNATKYLKDLGVSNYIYDPFNRDIFFNTNSMEKCCNGKASTVTCNNVLNVIAEEKARNEVIATCCEALNPSGTAYFCIYEGSRTGIGAISSKGWQENRATADYIKEIKKYFDNVTMFKGIIKASKPRHDRVTAIEFDFNV